MPEMMDSLFNRGPLQQDSGLLHERWGQDGSAIINSSQRLNVTGGSDTTVYTVTTGKKLFVKSVTQIDNSVIQSSVVFKDGTGGTEKYRYRHSPNTSPTQVIFDVPLVFETSFVVTPSNNSATHDTAFEGWEE